MSSRKLSLWLAAAATLLLPACSVQPPQPAAKMPYFIDGHVKTVDVDYLDRYACASGTPLICSCSSTKLGTCDCSCR